MRFIQKMCRYKSWANEQTFGHLGTLEESELQIRRNSCFPTIHSTLSHIYTVDDIFRAHLEGRAHGYHSKNLDTELSFVDLRARVVEMDAWWVWYVDRLGPADEKEVVNFLFVDGSEGSMTPLEMVLHSVNHSTYHRGYIDEMLYSISSIPPTTDFPVFLNQLSCERL